MKKLLCLITVIFLLLSMTACGNSTQEENNKPSTDNSQSQEPNSETTNTEKENESNEIKFTYSYKVPGKNIVIDVPSYQEMEKGFTQLYILHGEKYVAVTAAKNSTATDLSVAHEDAFAKFKENIQNYSYVNSLTVTQDATETINGIEVYK